MYSSAGNSKYESCYTFFNHQIFENRPENKQGKTIKTAVIEFNPTHREKIQNEIALLRAIKIAAAKGTKLIVTPELSTTGYLFKNYNDAKPYSETIPGNFTNKLKKIASLYNTNIVSSFMEIDNKTQDLFIAAVFIEPDGKLHRYRKINMWDDDKRWATPGNYGVQVFDTAIGKIVIGICMDALCSKFSQEASKKGAEVFISPTASNGEAIGVLEQISARHSMFAIGANRSGKEVLHSPKRSHHMVGMSSIYGPDGIEIIKLPYIENGKNHPLTRIAIGYLGRVQN